MPDPCAPRGLLAGASPKVRLSVGPRAFKVSRLRDAQAREGVATRKRFYVGSVLCGPGGDLLSRVLRQSTIGAKAFDGRVRDGIGSLSPCKSHQAGEERMSATLTGRSEGSEDQGSGRKQNWDFHWVYRVLAIRTIKSNERLVPVSFTHCCASTSGLSTWWSSTALQGELVLRLVSRLDAFSGYPFHI